MYDYYLECKMLLSRMLCFDPNQRAKLQDILKHPWMRSYAQYKKLKVFDFSDSNNNSKKQNIINNNISVMSTNSKSPTSCNNKKNIKFEHFVQKITDLFSFDSKQLNKRYICLQKEQLSLNNPFSVDSVTLVNSIFNNESNSNTRNTNVISQMFAYAVSREDETKENKIRLLKKVMNNQVSFLLYIYIDIF